MCPKKVLERLGFEPNPYNQPVEDYTRRFMSRVEAIINEDHFSDAEKAEVRSIAKEFLDSFPRETRTVRKKYFCEAPPTTSLDTRLAFASSLNEMLGKSRIEYITAKLDWDGAETTLRRASAQGVTDTSQICAMIIAENFLREEVKKTIRGDFFTHGMTLDELEEKHGLDSNTIKYLVGES